MAVVVVTIRDTTGVRYSNIQVILESTRGNTDTIIQPSYTDNNGMCTGYVYSTTSGTTYIRAYDVSDGFYLTDSKPIYFIAVKAYPFFDNFEYGAAGGQASYYYDWTSGQLNMSELTQLWQHGIPVGDDAIDNDGLGPASAISGSYVWGTDLDNEYSRSGNDIYNQYMWLRSPNIDLRTAYRPLLIFYDWLDIEGANYDFCRLLIRNSKSASEEYYLADAYQTDHLWQRQVFNIPSNFIGKIIYIQFQLHSDPGEEDAGWYIDDFYVREKADTSNSTLSANKNSLNVDYNETAIITINAKDYFGNSLAYVPVKLISSRGSIDTITPDSTFTTSSGTATFTLSTSTSGNFILYAYADSELLATSLNMNVYSRKQWVVINEIAFAGDSTGNYQYVELYNTTDTNINLTGWKFGNYYDTITTAEFSEKTINAKSYFLIERSEITTTATGDLISTNLKIRNSGDNLYLFDERNIIIDSAIFLSGWTAGDSSNYKAAERITGSNLWDTANNVIFLNNETRLAYGSPKAVNTAGISDFYSTMSCTITNLVVGNTIAISVLIKNYDNQPISNIGVKLETNRSGYDTITQPVVTNSSGYCTGYLYSTCAGTSIISISSPNNLTDSISIYWKADTVSKTKSFLTYSSPGGINENVQIIITYLDKFNNPVSGETGIIVSTADTKIQPTTLSDTNGNLIAYLSHSTANTIVFYVKYSADTLTTSGTIVFENLLKLPFIEQFPTTTFNSTGLWADSSGGVSIVATANAEPSEPNSLRLTNSGSVRTKSIDLSKYTPTDVEAYFYYELGTGGNAPTIADEVKVEIYLNTGWYEAFRLLFFPYYTTSFAKRTITLPISAFHTGFKLRFTTTDTNNGYYFLDDITIKALPSAQTTILTATTNIIADNNDSCLVSVFVRDAANIPLSGETVYLYSSRSSADTILTNPVVSNSSGTAYFYVKSTLSGTAVFSAVINNITIIDTAECYFRSGTVDTFASIVSAQSNVVGNGKTQAKVTIQLLDYYKNPVPDKYVQISSNDANDTIIQSSSPSDSMGYVYAYVISNDTGQSIITAINTSDSQTLFDTAIINFIEPQLVINELMYNPKGTDPNDEWFELYNATNHLIFYDTFYITDGEDTIIFKNFLLDSNSYYVLAYSANDGGEKISVDTVYGTIAPNFQLSNTGETITIYDSQFILIDELYYTNLYSNPPRLDDNQGRTLEKIEPEGSSTSSDNFDKSEIDSGTPGQINTVRVKNSILLCSDTIIYNVNNDSTIINIYIKDSHNNPVPNVNVKLKSSRNNDTIIQPVSFTDNNGFCTAIFLSDTAGYATITIETPAGTNTSLQLLVKNNFSGSTMYVTKHTTADTFDSAVITVYFKNNLGQPIVGETVVLSSDRTMYDTILNNYTLTNSYGTAIIYVQSNKIGTSVISVIEPADFAATVSLTVSAGTVSLITSTISSQHSGIINLEEVEITVQLLDYFNNPISNKWIKLFSSNSNDTIIQPTNPTNDSGIAIGYVYSPNVGISYITAADTSDSIMLSDSTYINFIEKKIIINEIMYYPASGDNAESEWIELYNISSETINLSGWYIKDNADSFIFPAGSYIVPDSYFLLEYSEAATIKAANAIYGNSAPNLILANSSESLLLYDTQQNLVDYLQYSASWDVNAAGTGKSLERISSTIETNNSINWQASSIIYGTPASLNTTKYRNTTLTLVKNNGIANGIDSNVIKIVVKDVNNNIYTKGLQLGVSSNRANDTIIIEPSITDTSGITYIYILSNDSNNAIISIDTPVGITANTITINFVYDSRCQITILTPATEIYTNTNIIITGTASNARTGDSVYLYQNSILTNTTIIQTGDTYFIFNNVQLYDTEINYYVRIITFAGYDTISTSKKIYYDTIAPSPPTNITISSIRTTSETMIIINWTNVTVNDLAGYNIYRDTDFDFKYSKINNSLIIDTNYYYDTDIQAGSEYIYLLTSVDSFTNESNYSDSVFAKNIIVIIDTNNVSTKLPGDTFDININIKNTGFSRITNPVLYFNLPSNCLFDTVFLNLADSIQFSFLSDSNWYDTPISENIEKIKLIYTDDTFYPLINLNDINDSFAIRLKIK